MTEATVLPPTEDSPMARNAELKQRNDARLKALAFEGKAPPAEIMLDIRLDLLCDFVLGAAIRPLFEGMYTEMVSNMLDQWEPHVRQSQLTQGVPGVDPSVA